MIQVYQAVVWKRWGKWNVKMAHISLMLVMSCQWWCHTLLSYKEVSALGAKGVELST
jgi:type III secretory pathway component EscS